MYCKFCGEEYSRNSTYCPKCGNRLEELSEEMQEPMLCCPQCGGSNIDIQMVQENLGAVTHTKTRAKYKQVKHGLLWWAFIGWWWWIFDLLLWVFAFPFRLAYGLLKKKKFKKIETSTSVTKNNVRYRKMFICKSCGYNWDKKHSLPSKRS